MPPLNPLQGEVWDVNFDPAIGSEIQKVRPCIVLNPDGAFRFPVRIVVPLTGWRSDYVGRWLLPQVIATTGNGLAKDSAADISQIRCVSVLRFRRRRGQLPPAEFVNLGERAAYAVGG